MMLENKKQSDTPNLTRLLTRSAASIALVALVFAALAMFTTSARTPGNVQPREGHAIWAHPPDVGKTAEQTREFVMKCKRANIDTIVMDLKGMSGEIYWKSKKFPQAIAKGYESFDVL